MAYVKEGMELVNHLIGVFKEDHEVTLVDGLKKVLGQEVIETLMKFYDKNNDLSDDEMFRILDKAFEDMRERSRASESSK